jgi:hypothetical protein
MPYLVSVSRIAGGQPNGKARNRTLNAARDFVQVEPSTL